MWFSLNTLLIPLVHVGFWCTSVCTLTFWLAAYSGQSEPPRPVQRLQWGCVDNISACVVQPMKILFPGTDSCTVNLVDDGYKSITSCTAQPTLQMSRDREMKARRAPCLWNAESVFSTSSFCYLLSPLGLSPWRKVKWRILGRLHSDYIHLSACYRIAMESRILLEVILSLQQTHFHPCARHGFAHFMSNVIKCKSGRKKKSLLKVWHCLICWPTYWVFVLLV